MKICFVLQAGFARIGHTVACHLKDEMPGVQFCAFAQSRTALTDLERQTEISYGPIPLEEDMHNQLYTEELDWDFLRAFEKEYGIPNLWPYLYIDRIIMHGQYRREYPYDMPSLSREDMLRRLQVTAKELLTFLDREQPQVVVFSVIGSVGSLLLYHMAKKRGIKTLVLKLTRIGRGLTLTEDYATFDSVRARFLERQQMHTPALEEAKTFLTNFRKKPKPYLAKSSPTYNNQAARSTHLMFLKPRKLLWGLQWYSKMLFTQLLHRPKDYTDILVWWTMWDKLKRKIRGIIGYQGLYSTPVPGERFAYYPLHVEPETALLLDAPYHTDQLEIIRAAAHALPIDMMLYIKEHPEMVGYRTHRYYREIAKIPNARLLNPLTSNYVLLGNTSLVFAVTGTAGFESILFKKPVITFTDVYYNDLSLVERCKSMEDLPYIINKQLKAPLIQDEELLHYLSALIEESVDVDYVDLWMRNAPSKETRGNQGLKNLSRLLAKRLTA